MDLDTGVQFASRPRNGRVWLSVGDPTEITGEIAERITLDVAPDDARFAEQLAKFWNALAVAKKTPLRSKWSRKTVGEKQFAKGLRLEHEQLKAMFEAVGEFPDPSDAKAMTAYVNRVIAWDKKNR